MSGEESFRVRHEWELDGDGTYCVREEDGADGAPYRYLLWRRRGLQHYWTSYPTDMAFHVADELARLAAANAALLLSNQELTRRLDPFIRRLQPPAVVEASTGASPLPAVRQVGRATSDRCSPGEHTGLNVEHLEFTIVGGVDVTSHGETPGRSVGGYRVAEVTLVGSCPCVDDAVHRLHQTICGMGKADDAGIVTNSGRLIGKEIVSVEHAHDAVEGTTRVRLRVVDGGLAIKDAADLRANWTPPLERWSARGEGAP